MARAMAGSAGSVAATSRPGHVGHVAVGERPAELGYQDQPVEVVAAMRQQRSKGQIARPPQHPEPQPGEAPG